MSSFRSQSNRGDGAAVQQIKTDQNIIKCRIIEKVQWSDVLPGSDASLSQVWNPGLPIFVDASWDRQPERRAFLLHQLHHRAAAKLVYVTHNNRWWVQRSFSPRTTTPLHIWPLLFPPVLFLPLFYLCAVTSQSSPLTPSQHREIK